MTTEPACSNCGQPLPPDSPRGLCPGCLMQAAFPTGATPPPDGSTSEARFSAPPVAELAASFPQLEILELLGQGGMGAVYRARQKHLHRQVALKILPPGIGADPSFTERFTREAQALAQLSHPGIVTLYEFGHTEGGLYYFLMELVEGLNLRQLLSAGRLSSREALAIVPQICDALQCAHDQGIVHRDIKPENILLDRRGRVKVADFGLAKLVGCTGEPDPTPGTAAGSATLTATTKVLGTPQYMAPEQVEQPANVDHRTDIYALGVVLYQMLTGEFPGKDVQPPSRKVQIDVRLDDVVLRALERKPELRYQQVSEVKTGVEMILDSTITPAKPAGSSSCGEIVGSNFPQAANDGGNKTEGARPEPRFSRIAIFGALWAGWFFVNWLWAYTPPGWAVTAAVRQSALGPVANVLLLAPLQLLGLAAPLGATALGIAALREIRQSRGVRQGFWLGLFDTVFFPLLLLNRWLLWLGHRVGSQIGQGDATSSATAPLSGWATAVLIIIALAGNGLMIRMAWAAGKRFVATPPPPTAPRLCGTWGQEFKKAILRLSLVFLIQFVLLETLQQVEVHWKESQGEPWDMALVVASLAALVWVFWPRFRLRAAPAYFLGGTFLSGALLLGGNILYLGPIRTSLGIYQEPDWMDELPGYQRRNRLGRAKYSWRRTLVGPSFAPTTKVLLPLEDVNSIQSVSLVTGHNVNHDRSNERMRDTLDWARSEQTDLMVLMDDQQLGVQGLDLAITPVVGFDRETRPQDLADYWLFEKYPPKETAFLWPPEGYWLRERKYARKDIPRPFQGDVATFLFRTRSGTMGVLEITGSPDQPRSVAIRYKLVQPATATPRKPL